MINRELLDSLPTPRNTQSFGYLAQGVRLSKPDVGGAQMMEQVNMRVHGASQLHTTMQIDGMLVSPAFSDGAIQNYMNQAHFAASTLRLYTKPGACDAHPFVAFALPLLVFAIVGLSVAFTATLGRHLWALAMTWSPYHYAAQAFGLASMYCHRSGLALAPGRPFGEGFALAARPFATLLVPCALTGASVSSLLISPDYPYGLGLALSLDLEGSFKTLLTAALFVAASVRAFGLPSVPRLARWSSPLVLASSLFFFTVATPRDFYQEGAGQGNMFKYLRMASAMAGSGTLDILPHNGLPTDDRLAAELNNTVDALPYAWDLGGPMFVHDPTSKRDVLIAVNNQTLVGYRSQTRVELTTWSYLGNGGGLTRDHARVIAPLLGPDDDVDGIPDLFDNCPASACTSAGFAAAARPSGHLAPSSIQVRNSAISCWVRRGPAGGMIFLSSRPATMRSSLLSALLPGSMTGPELLPLSAAARVFQSSA